MKIPEFDEWFEKKYGQTFDDRYCHGDMSQTGVLVHHIQHSREYMQEQLQAIADEQLKPK